MDYLFYLFVLTQIIVMEIFGLLGFLLSRIFSYFMDSLQTLGTWISSNKSVKWYYQWIFTSVILMGLFFMVTLLVMYLMEDWNRIFETVQWYHVLNHYR